jgi:hypothetical protein
MTRYLQPSISNGLPTEQALIRCWWHEQHGARGRIVWEYYLEGCYVDAVWFPDAPGHRLEEPGKGTGRLFPIKGENIVVCEAKKSLTPELIGQALVYSELARRAGANLKDTVVFAEIGAPAMIEVAQKFGLNITMSPLTEESGAAQQGAPAGRPTVGR